MHFYHQGEIYQQLVEVQGGANWKTFYNLQTEKEVAEMLGGEVLVVLAGMDERARDGLCVGLEGKREVLKRVEVE
jgi:hypothetical protein